VSDTSTLASTQSAKPPWYRDSAIIKWFSQIAALAVVVGLALFVAVEAKANLDAKNITTSFDFLEINPGFDISEGIDKNPNTGGRALWVGMVNTLRMATVGIVVASVLGILIGIARLSDNWMVHRAASTYIEAIRNIPVVVQILIYAAIFGGLGRLTQDSEFLWGLGAISAKGLSLPRLFAADGFYQWMVFIIIGAVVGWFVRQKRQDLQDSTGKITYPNLYWLGVIAAFGAVGWFIHSVFSFFEQIFDAFGNAWDSIPVFVMQLLLAALVVTASARWIRNFLDSKRTPAGLAKLIDDDYFRIVFSALGAVIGLGVIFVVWPGLSSWIVNSGADFWHFLADKFDNRTGQPIDGMMPTIEGEGTLLRYGPQGLTMTVWFAALFAGVTIYTSAFIAEIVRGGILAVPKGQTEAAMAVGLTRAQALRQVILPQAFRVSLPPLGNQYLNLTKNTSLGIAVGYADVVNVGSTVLNQTGQALSVIVIWMLFYLGCSLTISIVVNWWNIRLKLVER